MIYGIGVDTVKIERMAKSMARPAFMRRVFSEAEQALLAGLSGTSKPMETAAANFAAKEAFLKAAGTGLGGFALNEIAALREASGKPYYQLSGAAAAFCNKQGLLAHLSLSHEGGLATAFTVLERR